MQIRKSKDLNIALGYAFVDYITLLVETRVCNRDPKTKQQNGEFVDSYVMKSEEVGIEGSH